MTTTESNRKGLCEGIVRVSIVEILGCVVLGLGFRLDLRVWGLLALVPKLDNTPSSKNT